MARLGGISSEAVTTLPAGLASILIEHKAIFGGSNDRANVVLARESLSIASSPESSLCEADIGADHVDDLKEEDVWAADRRSWHPDISRSLQIQHGYNRGFSAHAPRVDEVKQNDNAENVGLVLGIAKFDVDVAHTRALGLKAEKLENGDMVAFAPSKQRRNGVEVVRSFPRQREQGSLASDVLTNTGLCQHATLGGTLPNSQDRLRSRSSTASRMIPRRGGGLGKHFAKGHMERQSAPIEVPDWSKIMAKQKDKKHSLVVRDDDKGGDAEDDDDRLPPHELLAKEYARGQLTTFSVCEGQGRTLKGRDLSRVRDAVWSQMGFAD